MRSFLSRVLPMPYLVAACLVILIAFAIAKFCPIAWVSGILMGVTLYGFSGGVLAAKIRFYQLADVTMFILTLGIWITQGNVEMVTSSLWVFLWSFLGGWLGTLIVDAFVRAARSDDPAAAGSA